jgi:outer membrane protein assembly factor BamB
MKQTLCSLALLATLTASAEDWRQFRGPQGNSLSVETNLPSMLDPGSVAWSIDLPGRGLSSPIIIGDRVIVTCSSGPRQERLHVICFDARDGSKRWERQFWATGRTMSHDKTSVAAPTPASDGERIFAIFSSNDLLCLDLDGNLLWLRGLTRDYPNASNSLGMSSSLATTDGVVIAMLENDSDSTTVGLDARTGTNRWKIARPKMANWTSPVLLTMGDGSTQVLLQSGKGVTAVEPATGRAVWEYTEGASTIPSSTVSDGVLFIPSQGLTALVPSVGDTKPSRLWRSAQLRPGTSSPVVVSNKVFVLNDGGVLSCGDAADGKRLWQLRLKGPFSATPVAAGNRLYCVNEKGLLQVVDVMQPEGAVISEMNLGQMILSTPSIAHGALFVRSDGKLWKLAQTGPRPGSGG